MGIIKKYLFFIILIFGINLTYSASSSLVCCYDGENILEKGSCNSEIEVGPANFDNPGNFCGEYKTRVGCTISTGVCTTTSGIGEIIYDWMLDPGFSLPGGCIGIERNINLCGTSTVINNPISGNTTPGTIIINPGNVGVNPFNRNGDTDIETSPIASTLISTCASAGGPYGFFASKNSCESIKDSNGESFCLYNPYKSGFLTTINSYDKSSIIGINENSFENSCVYKKQIKFCNHYKTKNNCNGNRADLDDSCKWLETSDFDENDISLDLKGICVSNYISNANDYNKNNFYSRGNLLRNPSFEDVNIDLWLSFPTDSGTDRRIDLATFHGNSILALSGNSILSQYIYFPKENSAYSPYLYFKYKNTLSRNLKLEINAFYKDGTPIELDSNSIAYSHQIDLITSPENKFEGIYQKVLFPNFVIPKGTHYISFNLFNLNLDTIELDAISFEESPGFSQNNNLLIFKPEEIISSSASNCNLCFEKSSFNTCTSQKSDLLGDCSYMVNNIFENYLSSKFAYTGKDENQFMSNSSNKLLSWESQSIANSNLFCEMYIKESQCIDPNNYINSKFTKYHLSSGNTLCKWSSVIGCFKDSDNDNYPDTHINLFASDDTNSNDDLPKLRLIYESDGGLSAFEDIGSYRYNNQDERGTSDFSLACDTLPPISYLYIKAINSSGSQIIINSQNSQKIGNLDVSMDIQDQILESCSNYYFEKKLFVDFIINGKSSYFKVDSNQFSSEVSLKTQFLDYLTSETMIQDGSNNISIIVSDRSGNLGKEWQFNLKNIDVSAPTITMISPIANKILGTDSIYSISNGPFTRSSNFNFKINDFSNFNCKLNINPLSSNIQNSYYDHSEIYLNSDTLIQDLNGDVMYIFNISEYIYETTENPNTYELDFSCSDVYGQNSNYYFIFSLDFDTSIVIIEPISFIDKNLNLGFLNGPTLFHAVSTEIANNMRCTLDFGLGTDFSGTPILNARNYLRSNPFFIESSPDLELYQNITGTLSFLSDGYKEGSITCKDDLNNIYLEPLSFYYDRNNPIQEDFNLLNIKRSGINSSIKINDDFYTIFDSSSRIKVNVNIDGINSWISNLENLTALNSNATLSSAQFSTYQLHNNSFKTSSIISNFETPLVYIGLSVENENNLYLKEFIYDIYDKSGNKNQGSFRYYFDSSHPSFNFSGDIITQDDSNSRIFTNNANNPRIKLSFNVPSYRKFSCEIYALEAGSQVSHSKFFTASNKLIFTLSEIHSSLATFNDIVSLDFSCIDEYGVKLVSSYTLVLDSKSPILNDISFYGNNNKFLPKEGSITNILIDRLQFNLLETEEIAYNCEYWFDSNIDYTCSLDKFKINFPNSGLQSTNDLNLLKTGNNPVDDLICVKSFNLENKLNNPNLNQIKTSIKVHANCMDYVNLKTEIKSVNLNITYLKDAENLIDMNYDFGNREIFPNVRSFTNYGRIAISTNSDGSNPLRILSNPSSTNNINSLNEYFYTTSTGISFDSLNFGDNLLYAVALGSDDSPIGDVISKNVYIDNIAPYLELEVLDIIDGELYADRFPFRFKAQDKNTDLSLGKLKEVQIYANGALLFSTLNISNFNSNYIETTQGLSSQFDLSGSTYEEFLNYINAIPDEVITLKLVAIDLAENKNETQISFTIRDGFIIILEQTDNTIISSNGIYWYSKDTSPKIKFKLSDPLVSVCNLIPFFDDKWDNLNINSQIINLNKDSQGSFTYDLSTLAGFDLSRIESSEVQVSINCLSSGNAGNFIRSIKLFNSLPDYVLSSSNGFYLNENPYLTTIEINSVNSPQKPLSCKYKIGSGNYISLGTEQYSFSKEIDYSSYSNGNYDLTIQCSDLLGNLGLEKSSIFKVDKNSNLDISDFTLSNNLNKVYLPNINTFNLGTENDFKLNFRLNKKIDTSCYYSLSSDAGIFNSISNFFSNLFGFSTKDIDFSSNPYQAEISFSITENSQLSITCDISGTQSITKSFNILIIDEDIGISISQ